MYNEIFSNCPTGILTQQMTTTSIPQRWTDENQTEQESRAVAGNPRDAAVIFDP